MPVVVIFLRGGADGLALVPPVGEDAYHRLRAVTGLAPGAGLRLDDRFALHPDLAPLRPWWDAGRLGIAPAAGIPEDSRSHFVAQDWLEHGGADVAGGWLGRWLQGVDEPLAAVALGQEMPESLRGAPAAVALQQLSELARPGGEELAARLTALAAGDRVLAGPSRAALEVHSRLVALAARTRPTSYPDDEFATRLATVAGLIHAGVGLRCACVDLPGWDSHIAMDTLLTPLRRSLAAGLAAFASDLGPALADTSIVVLTEFGRRCEENASLGTDHGRAGCAFVLGGPGAGGFIGAWPGLDHLEGPGDLPVATDLRGLLTSVLQRHGPLDAARIFPGFQPVSVQAAATRS
jgi:uncharacterized protein (DUF1501 family)